MEFIALASLAATAISGTVGVLGAVHQGEVDKQRATQEKYNQEAAAAKAQANASWKAARAQEAAETKLKNFKARGGAEAGSALEALFERERIEEVGNITAEGQASKLEHLFKARKAGLAAKDAGKIGKANAIAAGANALTSLGGQYMDYQKASVWG